MTARAIPKSTSVGSVVMVLTRWKIRLSRTKTSIVLAFVSMTQ
jgi:hypothetical protein